LKFAKTQFKRISGQLATLLNLVIAICLVIVIGLFAFEMSRYFLARDELKTNVEVAALSCQTNLVSLGDPTDPTNQSNSKQAGLTLFQQNSILGQPMSSAILVDTPANLSPAPNQAQIAFQFLDPLTKLPLNASGAGVINGVTNPDTAGTLIQATGAYAYTPAFGQFIGLGNAQFTFQVAALSGVPKIDLVVVLDISRGMDNDTALTFFQRYEEPTGTDWLINPNPGGSGPASGLEEAIVCPPNDVNVLPPHEFDQGEAISNSTCKLYHSGGPNAVTSNGLFMGAGTPPGNFCLTDSSFSSGASGSSSFVPVPTYFAPDGSLRKNRTNHLTINSDQGLLQLCAKIAGKHAITDKTDYNQIDDKLSTISFAPQFSSYPLVSTGGNPLTMSGMSGGTTSTTSGGGGGSNPPITSSYVGANGLTYCSQSRQPGSNADIGPPLLPTINGFGCSPSSPVVCGPPAPNVYTGVFANGVVGVTSADSSMNLNCAATAIEAMLGNLESTTRAQQAGDDTVALGVTPQAGWYAFYYNTARQYVEPYMALAYSLIGFINELAIVSDVHYGLVTFNDNVGTNANSVGPAINNESANFSYPTMNPDGTASITNTFPLPNIQLNTAAPNQAAIINVLPTLSVWGGRNVSQALQTAYNELQANGRPGANQAILLVTCGPPNGNDTPANAITEAGTIGAAGIPVYVVCVALSSNDDSSDDSAYTDIGGSNGGVAAASGHGAKYYRVDFSNPSDTGGALVTSFGNIARRLVSIVQGN